VKQQTTIKDQANRAMRGYSSHNLGWFSVAPLSCALSATEPRQEVGG